MVRVSSLVIAVALGAGTLTTARPASAHNGFPDSPSQVTCYNHHAQIMVQPKFTQMNGYGQQYVTTRAHLWEWINGRWTQVATSGWLDPYLHPGGGSGYFRNDPSAHTFRTRAVAGFGGYYAVTTEIAWWTNGRWAVHMQPNARYSQADGYGSSYDYCVMMWYGY